MTEIVPGRSLKDPVCSLSLGHAPQETVDLDEFDAKIDAKQAAVAATDLDEDFYGDQDYNADEFDAEGFDEMNFDN